MKKFFYILLVILVSFYACKKNSTDNEGIDVLGTWTLESFWMSDGNQELTLYPPDVTSTLTFEESNFSHSLNVPEYGIDVLGHGTYTISDKDITLNNETSGETYTGKYFDSYIMVYMTYESYSYEMKYTK